jgi:hypothetical protein
MDPDLACDDLPVRVGVGSERRVAVRVHNPGDTPDHYRFDVLGEPGRWSRVEPRRVPEVESGGTAVVELSLQPPPPTPAGVLPIAVRCESLKDAARCAVVEGEVIVGATQDLEVAAAAVSARGRHAGQYIVDVVNHGTVPADVRLSATDPREELGFALAPRELTVAPGESERAYLSARARRPRLAGRTIAHRFAVEHRSGSGPNGRLPLRFDQCPVLGGAATASAALLALALTAAGGLLLWPTVRDVLAQGRGDDAATTARAPSSGAPGVNDPVRGFYVVWGVTVVGDVATAGTLEQSQARLQAAGVGAQIVDSRDSDLIQEAGGQALRVLIEDGFPTLAAAEAECQARRTLVPNCAAGPQ